MGGQQIRIGDWQRILFGHSPPAYVIEVLARTFVVFLMLVVLTRFLGKRMNGQLTIMEMAVMLTLGAIAAGGMQIAEQGVLHALFALACALAFQRGMTWLEVKSRRIERITQGAASMLVKQGVLQLDELGAARISRDQLFAMLRGRGIFNLGCVKRTYLETAGLFSVFPEQEGKPGLCLLPEADARVQSRRRAAPEGTRACKSCGLTLKTNANARCPNCGQSDWDMAVV